MRHALPLFVISSAGAVTLLVALSGFGGGPAAQAQLTTPAITNVNSFLDQCPTNDPAYAQIRADFEIRKEGVPVGIIPCTEPISSMPISQYTDELILAQSLRAMYYMEGGRNVAYPWATGSMYDWMKSRIGGVDISVSGSSCCGSFNGEWYAVISSQNQWDREAAREWQGISYRITILAHEARHVDGFPHVGGCLLFPTQGYGCDQTYDEANLAPYGIEWWLNAKWLSGELSVGFGCLTAGQRQEIANWHLGQANNEFRGRFVDNAPLTLTMPAQPGGACSVASPTATVAPTPTTTASPTPTPSPTHAPSPSPTPTATVSPTAAPTVTSSPTPTATANLTATSTPASSLSPPQGPTATPAVTPNPPPIGTPTPKPTAMSRSDADCDGDVDSLDGLAILRFVGGISESRAAVCSGAAPTSTGDWGDTDCDSDVDIADVLSVLRHVAGLAGSFGEACPPPAPNTSGEELDSSRVTTIRFPAGWLRFAAVSSLALRR